MDFFNLNLADLKSELSKYGIKEFHANALFNWIYKRAESDPDKMSNIPNKLRDFVREEITVKTLEISDEQKSKDGTIKWLFKLEDGNEIESVYIPEEKRATLCISSQVGCTLNCKFCFTGTQKLVKNLSAGEIVNQVYTAKKLLDDFKGEQKNITNIVFMGMGEPLLNYDNVKKSCEILLDPQGFYYGRRKITLSTSGIVPNIIKAADEIKVALAVSFHATDDETRTKIMPINKKYNLEKLIASLKEYQEKTGGKNITLEYVMLDGVNDSDEHAENLIKLRKELLFKVNLIPFNPWPSCLFATSKTKRIHEFANYLRARGVESPIRRPRGKDILAACGQLKSKSLKESASSTKSLVTE
jgi:23S rRNA (adenine2503-C2)-methyltransferase